MLSAECFDIRSQTLASYLTKEVDDRMESSCRRGKRHIRGWRGLRPCRRKSGEAVRQRENKKGRGGRWKGLRCVRSDDWTAGNRRCRSNISNSSHLQWALLAGKLRGVFWAAGTSITGCQRDCLVSRSPWKSIDTERVTKPRDYQPIPLANRMTFPI